MLVTLTRISLFFGTFPYVYDGGSGEKVLHFSYFGVATSIISSMTQTWLSWLLIREHVFAEFPADIGRCIMSAICGSLPLMLVIRLTRWDRMKAFFEEIFHLYETNADEKHDYETALNFWLILGTAFVRSILLTYDLFKAQTIMQHELGGLLQYNVHMFLIINTPTIMEVQYVCSCVILQQSFTSLDKKLRNVLNLWWPLVNGGHKIREIRKTHLKLMKLVRRLNVEFGLEAYILSHNLIIVSIYWCNEIILANHDDGKIFQLSTLFFLTFHRLWWMCHEAEKLARKAIEIQDILLKYNLASLPERTYEETEKFLDQLSIVEHYTTIYEFFHLNKEFLFSAFEMVAAFIIIFVQLKVEN